MNAELAEAERRARTRFVRSAERPVPRGGGREGADVAAELEPVEQLTRLLAEELPLVPAAELGRRARELAADLIGLGELQRLLDAPDVSDVLVNGPGRVWVERAGRLELSEVSLDTATIERNIERLVGPLGLQADRAHPVVDARLPDGTRVAVVLPPLAVDGPIMALRRHPSRVVSLDAFAPPPVVGLLGELVERRCNIAVYGATGAGKTTLLNALVSRVAAGERIVTIEDVAELQLPGDHVVRLEARPGTADGVGRAAIRDLVRAALRLRPDRIVVGEVRGAEANDMIWALSTGHDGSFATWHASGAEDALTRLATLCASSGEGVPLDVIRAQIHTAIDVLVGVERCADGRRRVRSVHALAADGSLSELLRAAGGTHRQVQG